MARGRIGRLGVLAALLVGAALWAQSSRPARADVAPDPMQGGLGRDAGPAGVTAVQMVSETVLIDITPLSDVAYYAGEPIQIAHVTADFLLRNPATVTEALPVGFPLFLSSDYRRQPPPEVFNIRIFQSGAELPTTNVDINSEPWEIWNMTFAPGDTWVQVTYDFQIMAREWTPYADIRYVLHTGAGWAGPIGQANLIVRFPYLAEENFIDPRSAPAGHQISGYEVTWQLLNLEPTAADDVNLRVANPQYWYDVLAARTTVAAEPNSSNYLALAQSYADLLSAYEASYSLEENYLAFYSPLLAQVTEAQYRKAVELDPANAAVRQAYFAFVQTYAGSLLPGTYDDYVSTLPGVPTRTVGPTATLPASSATPGQHPVTASPESETQLPTPTARLISLTPTATNRPATQVAVLSPVALFTPVPSPSADTTSANYTGWLLAVLAGLIVVGVVIALRQRG